MKLRKNLSLFSIGAVGYGIIEVLWRGFTHPSMLLAGGFSFLSLSYIGERFKKTRLYKKAILGMAAITVIEFVFGVVFNIILKKKVWDYSDMPFNILGQVCPAFSLAWFFLSFIFIPISTKISKNCK